MRGSGRVLDALLWERGNDEPWAVGGDHEDEDDDGVIR